MHARSAAGSRARARRAAVRQGARTYREAFSNTSEERNRRRGPGHTQQTQTKHMRGKEHFLKTELQQSPATRVRNKILEVPSSPFRVRAPLLPATANATSAGSLPATGCCRIGKQCTLQLYHLLLSDSDRSRRCFGVSLQRRKRRCLQEVCAAAIVRISSHCNSV